MTKLDAKFTEEFIVPLIVQYFKQDNFTFL